MDRGVAREADLNLMDSGWLVRAVRLAGIATPNPVTAAGPAVPLALAGEARALAVPDVAAAAGLPGGDAFRSVLTRLYASGDGPTVEPMRRLLAATALLDRRIERGSDGRPAAYAGAAAYESTGEAGRLLQVVARLAKLDIGLSAAAVDVGG